jgi:hypothetical protein
MNGAVGTAASTGGHGNLGGAIATLGKLFTGSSGTTAPVQGNTVWITGTLTVTSTINVTKAASGGYYRIVVIGYGTSRGDGGQATITTATNSVALFTLGGQGIELRNLNLTTTAGTKAAAIIGSSSAGNALGEDITIRDCTITGFTIGIDAYNGGYGNPLVVIECTITGCSSHGIYTGGFLLVIGCYIEGNTGDGINAPQYGTIIAINTVSSSNTGKGFNYQTTNNGTFVAFKQCVAYNNGSDGIYVTQSSNTQPLVLINSIIYNNAGYGINGNTSQATLNAAANPFSILVQLNNAFGSNTSGARLSGIPSDTTDIALTANPFNNAGTGDFSLNSTSGGGALCLGTGWQPSTI